MLSDPVLFSNELDEARIIELKLLLIENSIVAKGPLLTDCWLWKGNCTTGGYDHIRWPPGAAEPTTVHRLSWIAFVGPIPDGLYCLHKCDVKACIRPDHLYVGTQQDNVDDRERAKANRRWRRL